MVITLKFYSLEIPSVVEIKMIPFIKKDGHVQTSKLIVQEIVLIENITKYKTT